MIIVLPWPPRELSPNARKHWRAKVDPKNDYKFLCKIEARKHPPLSCEGNIPISIVFHPPRRSGDIDNYLASVKYGLDAICEVLNINDKRLRPMTLDVGEPVKDGCVKITINNL